MNWKLSLFFFSLLLSSAFAFATDRISAGTGSWASATTWSPSGVPASGDNITVLSGHTISVNSTSPPGGFCNNLTINGSLGCNTNRTLNVGANITINNGGVISGGSGTLNVTGNLSVPSSATVTIGSVNLSVTGLAIVDGRISINSTTGTKTFGGITVNSGGTWTASVAENVTINGDVINSGTITTNSGTYTVNGNYYVNAFTANFEGSISGTLTIANGATMNVPTGILTVTGGTFVSGSLNFTTTTGTKTFGDVTVNSGGTWNCTIVEAFTINGNISNSGTFTSGTGVYTLAGTAKTISGTVAVSSATINGSYTNNGTFTVNTALSGTGSLTQGAGSTLNIGGTSGITTLNASANTPNTVNYKGSANQTVKVVTYYDLTVTSTGGTVTFGAITVNNNFTVSTGTVSIGAVTMSVAGATGISGTLNITSATGTKTFGDVTINSGGTWNATIAEAFTVNGSISNSGTFTSNNGTYTLAGSGKTISGTLSISHITTTGSYTNNAALTVATLLSGGGTFSQGITGTLNIGANPSNFSVTTFNASTSGNTVNYNLGGAQNVRVPSDGAYHHLTIGGTGSKTLLSTTAINGNLSISSTLDVSSSNFAIALGGNWTNTGIFTPRNGTVIFNGSGAQSITRSGGETFYDLAIEGAGTKSLGSAITTVGSLSISSTFDVSSSNYGVTVNGDWKSAGTFIARNGTVTFSGMNAQVIGGSSTTDFYNITQNNSAGVSLANAENLSGVLTISAGTFTTTGFNFTLISNANGTARIATIPSGANFAGNIIMQRYSGTGPTDWRFLGSPVAGSTIADWADDFATSGFVGSTDPTNSFVSIYSYNEAVAGSADSGYVAATNVTNSTSNGKGFWVYLGPTPVTFEVTGPPNTFTVSPSITYTNSGNSLNDGWNLITNPYPSAIDWNSSGWTKTNVDDAVYIYNSSTGSYASYVAGIGVNGGSQYIPSSQAFWVKANAASPVLRAVELVKASPDPTFFKYTYTSNTSRYPMAFKDYLVPLNTNGIPNSIRLTANGNGYEDETFIRFTQGATKNFDSQADAWKLANVNAAVPNLSSVVNDTSDLSINSMPELTSNVVIPIRLTVPATGTYSISRDSILMLPMSSCIILEDLANGNMTDLRSIVSYSFTISDTTKAPRFLLHVYAPITKKAIHTLCAGDSSGMAIAMGAGSGPWNYVWKDTAGKILRSINTITSADTLKNILPGIYFVSVSGSACGIVTDTIEIKSSSTLLAVANYKDVSCYGMNDGSAYAIVAGGVLPVTYLWSNGATTSAINNLSAGNYSVTVTDAAGCMQNVFVIVSQPAVLLAGFTSSTDSVDLSVNNSVSFINSSSGATLYFWDFGDGGSDTVQHPVHYYSSTGTYTVMLIASNGTCSDTSYKTIFVVDYTFVQENPENASLVNVFYDHGDVYLTFDLPDKSDVAISVYNSIGEKVIYREEKGLQKDKVRINVKDFSSGVYVAVADVRNAVIARKIIIPSR